MTTFDDLCDRRAARAEQLAARFTESAEPLRFYGAVASFQKRASAGALLALVRARGPKLLSELAHAIDVNACAAAVAAYRSGADRTSPTSFFGRALLQPDAARGSVLSDVEADVTRCPRCAHPPQVGFTSREGDGTIVSLACSLCFHEWRHPRDQCPSCGASNVVHYHAPELAHLAVQACDECCTYINIVRADDAPAAVFDVDELAALPLDVWAHEQGYRKLVRNLVGI